MGRSSRAARGTGSLSAGDPGIGASPSTFSPNKHLLDLLPLSYGSVIRAQEEARLCFGDTSVGGGQPPGGTEPEDSLSHRSNCTCLRGSQENSLEMQELKTVNWDFQVTLSPPPSSPYPPPIFTPGVRALLRSQPLKYVSR